MSRYGKSSSAFMALATDSRAAAGLSATVENAVHTVTGLLLHVWMVTVCAIAADQRLIAAA
ncbi:hypothetical protein D8771_27205 [Streptomyces albus]|uniref:Uncharacterized protein n=1 Tax=Streptomyces albus TaxID=1888 RepID=A0A8H1QMK1_9ACTN|nr:hypothetical protein D8771_27205 [Streptomyces albus]